MSDQGSTGGDVWIVSSDGGQPRDLTQGRPTSPAWIEWGSNDYLFVSELAGGNSQLLRYKLSGDRTGSGQVTFGSPIFSIPGSVGDGRMEMSLSSTADRSMFVFGASNFEHPREIYAAKPGTVMTSGLEGVMQLSHFNDGVQPAWGKAVSLSAGRATGSASRAGCCFPKITIRTKNIRSSLKCTAVPPRRSLRDGAAVRRPQLHRILRARLLCSRAQSSRQLRPGRSLHAGQPQRLRLRRPARHSRRRRYRAGQIPDRSPARGHYRLELRRIHDHVCRHPDQPLQGRGLRCRSSPTGRATTAKTPSTSG